MNTNLSINSQKLLKAIINQAFGNVMHGHICFRTFMNVQYEETTNGFIYNGDCYKCIDDCLNSIETNLLANNTNYKHGI